MNTSSGISASSFLIISNNVSPSSLIFISRSIIDGSLWNLGSNVPSLDSITFLALCKSWTTLTGSRMVLALSFNDCKIDCLTHQTAYDIKRKSLCQSKFLIAFINPKFPSAIKSGKSNPWFWYCLATVITNRKLPSSNSL